MTDVQVQFYDAEGKPLCAVTITGDSLDISRGLVPQGAASFSVSTVIRGTWAQDTTRAEPTIRRDGTQVIQVSQLS